MTSRFTARDMWDKAFQGNPITQGECCICGDFRFVVPYGSNKNMMLCSKCFIVLAIDELSDDIPN